MKYFQLTDVSYRESVSLKPYENDIKVAVSKVKPEALVFVEDTFFFTVPELGKRESILVSRELRRNSGLNNYTMQRPCLFSSFQHSNDLSKEES